MLGIEIDRGKNKKVQIIIKLMVLLEMRLVLEDKKKKERNLKITTIPKEYWDMHKKKENMSKTKTNIPKKSLISERKDSNIEKINSIKLNMLQIINNDRTLPIILMEFME